MLRQQLNLFTKSKFPNLSGLELEFGGSLRKGRRKIARPIDPKRAVHIVLRSTRARGSWSFLHPQNVRRVRATVDNAARRFGVKVHGYSNVGNHLHLIAKAPTREAFQKFLKAVSGRIAARVTGAKKGNAVGRFWDHLAYTRVLAWGRDFINAQIYLTKNLFEGEGVRLLTSRGYRTFRIVSGRLQV